MNNETRTALCGASAYDCKYYVNEQFSGLPPAVLKELRILCTLFTEEVGGVFTVWFESDGSVSLETEHEENDIYYDEVTSGLMVREVRSKRGELFAALETYYKVFVKGKKLCS
ncbi:MAG: DUF6145 family protein [Lachnospiraceae bacterium]|jgi:hypothetical protein|nr:DUF6145 family protein [Lachnospiraceae bacterium]